MRKKCFWVVLFAAGLFIFTPDALADWSAAKRLTWTSGDSYAPAIAMDTSGFIHLVWFDYTPGNWEIYYKRGVDGGTTWSTVKRLTWTSGNSFAPAIAIDSINTIHVVWQDYTPGNGEIYYKKSTDGGITWSAAQRLTWTSDLSEYAAIETDSSDTIHVVWQDYTPGNYEIYYLKSTDRGSTWSAAQRLTWTSDWSRYPTIAIDVGNAIHFVWQDDTPGQDEIYYLKSTDGGSTWSAAQRLTWTSGGSFWPVIATDSSTTLYVVWYGYDFTPSDLEIYYKKSTDGGSTWSAVKRLTWTQGSSNWPAMAIDSINTIHVIWEDYAPFNYEIYYKKSTDGGTAWSTIKRLTWTSGSSHFPTIAIDSSNTLHVVWYDDTPGNYEIYYKRGM